MDFKSVAQFNLLPPADSHLKVLVLVHNVQERSSVLLKRHFHFAHSEEQLLLIDQTQPPFPIRYTHQQFSLTISNIAGLPEIGGVLSLNTI